jgi:LPXTG-motif cell wall-anchored protein
MQYTQDTTNDRSTLRRRIAATAMTTGLVVFGVAVAPGVASAHHPILSGTTSCRTDAWAVTWTATADADRDTTWSITSPADYSPSGFQDDQTAFTRTATYPGTQASAAETVTAEWSNGSTAAATANVDRPPLCDVATTTTTTTPTTTLPETTTTTIAPESTTSVADEATTTTTELATTTSVRQEGPTSIGGRSSAASVTTGGSNGQLPATGSGSLNLTIIALTLTGIGAVALRLSSRSAR